MDLCLVKLILEFFLWAELCGQAVDFGVTQSKDFSFVCVLVEIHLFHV